MLFVYRKLYREKNVQVSVNLLNDDNHWKMPTLLNLLKVCHNRTEKMFNGALCWENAGVRLKCRFYVEARKQHILQLKRMRDDIARNLGLKRCQIA